MFGFVGIECINARISLHLTNDMQLDPFSKTLGSGLGQKSDYLKINWIGFGFLLLWANLTHISSKSNLFNKNE